MNSWILVLLLVYSTTFNTCTSQEGTCTEGNIVVKGLIKEDAASGRMELCYNQEWRAVCAGDWDLRDATVVCRQILNLSQSAEILVEVCKNSCFGSSTLTSGIRRFNCTGMESRLTECTHTNNNGGQCLNDAGIICFITEAEEHTTCPDTECPTHSIGKMDDTEGGRDEQQKADVGLGGGLGTLAAVLILILAGVVLGWVWSCHRNRNKQQDTTFDNPTYDITAFTPTQYSSHGPGAPPADTSDALTADSSATPPTYETLNKKTSKKQRKLMQSAGNENVLPMSEQSKGGEGEVGGDVEYQVLGATYEVPVATETSVQPAAATNIATQDEEYSTLKYN